MSHGQRSPAPHGLSDLRAARRSSTPDPGAFDRRRPRGPALAGGDAQLLLPLRRGAPAGPPARPSTASGSPARACGFIAYVNPRLVVTTLPVTEAGEASCSGAGSSRAAGSGPSRAASSRSTRRSPRARSARRSRRRACSSSRARSSASTRAWRRRRGDRVRGADRGRRADVTPEALEVRAVRARRDPVGRDRVQDDRLGAPGLGGASATRTCRCPTVPRPRALGRPGASASGWAGGRAASSVRSAARYPPRPVLPAAGCPWRSPPAPGRRRPSGQGGAGELHAASISGSASRARPAPAQVARLSARPRPRHHREPRVDRPGPLHREPRGERVADRDHEQARLVEPARSRIARLAASPNSLGARARRLVEARAGRGPRPRTGTRAPGPPGSRPRRPARRRGPRPAAGLGASAARPRRRRRARRPGRVPSPPARGGAAPSLPCSSRSTSRTGAREQRRQDDREDGRAQDQVVAAGRISRGPAPAPRAGS